MRLVFSEGIFFSHSGIVELSLSTIGNLFLQSPHSDTYSTQNVIRLNNT